MDDRIPILAFNNDTTRRGTMADIALLKECDDVRTYRECGWFCVAGWKDDKRLVHAHFNSEEEYRAMRSPVPASRAEKAHFIATGRWPSFHRR